MVQAWSKLGLLVFVGLVVALHISSIVLSVTQCPEMLVARTYPGVHCQPQGEVNMYGLLPHLGGGCESPPASLRHTVGEGVCLTRGAGDSVRLSDIRMSFKFPADGSIDEKLSAWNWRVVASLSVNINMREKDLVQPHHENSSLSNSVRVSASLDYAPMPLLTGRTKNSSPDCVPSSPWHSKAIVLRVNRTLDCKRLPGLSGLQHKTTVDSELSFHCSLHPLFELLALSNSSYIVQVRLEGESLTLLASNSTVSSYLTLVKETELFHRLVFYTKCFFTPIVLLCLVWFIIRLCVNDLYVSIPDRLLITVGLAQTLVNMPTEVVMTSISSPTLSLLDPLAYLVLVTSLAIFWVVFTKDKLATNEPWERNTRFYWQILFALLLASTIGLLGLLYLKLPVLFNPFNSHWLVGTPTIVSLSFLLSLVVIVASYQTFFSVLIFRVVCDISLRYNGTSWGCWRLKTVLLYCLVCSVLVCVSIVTRLAIGLILHWNTEVHTNPLPFAATLAGMIYLAELSSVNLHICCLLVCLSDRKSVV